MKIMFYNEDISVSSGGTERVMTNLANQFSKAGHEVIFFTYTRGAKEYPLNGEIKRIIVAPEDPQRKGKWKTKVMIGLRKAIRKSHPDVLITFGVGMISRAMVATFGLPVKNIISYQCSPYWDFRTILNRYMMRTLHQRTDGIVFQTQESKDFLPKAMQAKGKIIFNQVDDKFYNTIYEGVRKDIVSVGRLKGMKNHKMLINAFAAISSKISDNLLIYGAGELYDELQSQIRAMHLEDRVFLKGLCSDIPNAIKSAKLFVMSSDHEGCPNALMEAMALGIPCISTACKGGGPQMLFGEELKDCLVPVDNAQAMADKILEMLSNDDKRGKIGMVMKEKAEAFRPKSVFKQWEDYVLRFQ